MTATEWERVLREQQKSMDSVLFQHPLVTPPPAWVWNPVKRRLQRDEPAGQFCSDPGFYFCSSIGSSNEMGRVYE